MKTTKILLAAALIGGSLGVAPGLLRAQDPMPMHRDLPRESIEDDGPLRSNAPQTIEDLQNMSEQDRRQLETTLAQEGYDPGPIDGVIDDQTRAAIQEFQTDHQMVATGIIDPQTGELLGVVISQSS